MCKAEESALWRSLGKTCAQQWRIIKTTVNDKAQNCIKPKH